MRGGVRIGGSEQAFGDVTLLEGGSGNTRSAFRSGSEGRAISSNGGREDVGQFGRAHGPLPTQPSETLGQLPCGEELTGGGADRGSGFLGSGEVNQSQVTLEDHEGWWRRVLVRSASTRKAPPGWQQGGVTHRRPVIPCLSRMTSKSEGY